MTDDAGFISRAARLALRGHGGAEPNPMVGCVIADAAGAIVGSGHHRRCGGPHAEIEALRAAGDRARGATAYVTLEPCDHVGRTGPCAQALIEAGIARVVIGRRDPTLEARGGLERLVAAGVEASVLDHPDAVAVTEPFVHRVSTGLPWVVAKWAQTLDGRIATRTGESQWISSEASRRMVHRERGRVDAIMTGIGTVLVDDPRLTARCRRPRRTARRVVVDPKLQIPLESRLVATARDVPVTVAAHASLIDAQPAKADALRERGVDLAAIPTGGRHLALEPLLRELAARHDVATVLVEAGSGLLGRLFAQRLVCAAWVFVAPLLLGDAEAVAPVRGMMTRSLVDGIPMRLTDMRRRGTDVMLRYRVGQ